MKNKIITKAIGILLSLIILIVPLSTKTIISADAVGSVISVATEQELYNAITGITTTNPTTIELTDNIAIGNVYSVLAPKRMIINNGQNIILDLGNYTLSCSWYYNAYMIEVRQGATLTILSDADGKIYKSSGGRCLRNQGTLIVNGNIEVPGVSGGTTENRMIYNEAGSVTIQNGIFYGEIDTNKDLGYVDGSWIVNGSGTMVILDGIFISKVSPASGVEISGGRFYNISNFVDTWVPMLKAGYTYTREGSYYIVKELDYSIIDTGFNQYADMITAIDSTSDTETLTLINSLLTVTSDQEWNFGGRTLVTDGYTITVEPGVVITSDVPLDCLISEDNLYGLKMEQMPDGTYQYVSEKLPYIARIGDVYYGNVEQLKKDAALSADNLKKYLMTGTKTSDMPIVTAMSDFTVDLGPLESMLIDKDIYSVNVTMSGSSTHYNSFVYDDGYSCLYWCHLLGDTQGDNECNVLDLVRLKKVVATVDTSVLLQDPAIRLVMCDVNEDGNIDSVDLILMRKYLLGVTTSFK